MTETKKIWGDKPYYSLDYYLKQTYGEKVYRLSLNGGMTCPNRDGTLGERGCIFCSGEGSGEFASPKTQTITEQIEAAKEKIRKKTSARKFIAYFQAYTNTYAPVSYLEKNFYGGRFSPGCPYFIHRHQAGLSGSGGFRAFIPDKPDKTRMD